mgnify:CR=1 FL=1
MIDMGDITRRSNAVNAISKNGSFGEFDFLSIFDEQFSIDDLDRSIRSDKERSGEVISRAREAVINAFMDTEETGEAGYHYEVCMSDELKQRIESGEAEFVTGKDGAVYAMLRGEKGHFSKRLPIEKRLEEQGISVEQLQMALQMEAMRKQLESMLASLKSIEGRVMDVLQGQQNDRIGLFYSGLSLYSESQSIKDETLKTQIQIQALKALSDANSQVIQEMRTCIEYLAAKKYMKQKNGPEEIENRLSTIAKCYDVVYRSTFLKAAIYYEKGEVGAMLTTIDEYGRFVQKLMAPNAARISELDRSEKFIEKGTWGKIANTLSVCGEMRRQLQAPETFMLSLKGDDDEQR